MSMTEHRGHTAPAETEVSTSDPSGSDGRPVDTTAHTPGAYQVWRRYPGGAWIKTAKTLNARSDHDAQARMRRYFQGAGFTSMSLFAVPAGVDPNESAEGRHPVKASQEIQPPDDLSLNSPQSQDATARRCEQ